MVERVGKAARGLLDLAKAPDPDIAIGLLIDQRRRVRSRPGMPAADRLGNIETGRDLPPEGVIDLLVRAAGEVHDDVRSPLSRL